MKFKLHEPTSKLLKGLTGLEIGASAHNSFGVKALNVAPAATYEFYAAEQRKLGNEPSTVDIDAYAKSIPVEDSSVDFVLSSHVVEYLPDPIRAFREWQRIVKPGGYIVMIVPRPEVISNGTPLSTYIELRDAYKAKPTDMPDGHCWLFSLETLKEFIAKLSKGRSKLYWDFVEEEAIDSKVGNGFYLAYQVNKPK